MQIESIRHAIGNAGHAHAGCHTPATHAGFCAKQLVLIRPYAGINADLAGQLLLTRRLQTRACISCVFDRHPRVLQKQALLLIHKFCFEGRYVKEERIELIRTRDKASPLTGVLSTFAALFAEILSPVPPLLRNFSDAVFAFAQILPKSLEVSCLWIAAA